MVFEHHNLVCTAHASGDMHVFLRPGMGGGPMGGGPMGGGAGGHSMASLQGHHATVPPGSDSAHPNSFGMYRYGQYGMYRCERYGCACVNGTPCPPSRFHV